ncbi:MAG TPA: SGNH/GDSL hydrolase family protein [Clostridia bacterium]|nr:SGNH/GDSL hydrolase family protein [Clostridia bacterium]
MSPKRFFIGLISGLVLALAVFFGSFYRQLGAPTLSSQWCYEINTKKQQIAQSIAGPKLLLVGGSSTLFGLSAREIQAETGVPTVNLGTHAALGPEYILHLARHAAKPGDTVMLGLEYEVYDYTARVKGPGWTDQLYFDYLFARDPEYFRSWPLPRQFQTAMLISNRRLKEGLRNRGQTIAPIDGGAYNSTNLNAFGDQTGNTFSKRPATGEPWLSSRSHNLAAGISAQPTGLRNLRNFIQWARQNNVRVLATYPSICFRPEYVETPGQRTEKAIRDFFESEGVPVVGNAREAMLDPDQFFDTLYHPTEEGARARTRRLLVHLAPLLTNGNGRVQTANSAAQ